MRTNFDFSPLFRSSVGFDRVFDLLENASQLQVSDNWPPYDIVRTDDDAYRITMAVAGFTEDNLNVIQEQNVLVVRGNPNPAEAGGDYIHRGIAGRPFQRRFELADYVRVANATLEEGLLTIDLVREIPDEMKPRNIEIGRGSSNGDSRQIERKKAA